MVYGCLGSFKLHYYYISLWLPHCNIFSLIVGCFLNVKVWMSVDSLSLFQKLILKPGFSGDAKMFYSSLYWMYLRIKGVDFFFLPFKNSGLSCVFKWRIMYLRLTGFIYLWDSKDVIALMCLKFIYPQNILLWRFLIENHF